MNPELESTSMLARSFEDFSGKESQIEVLKLAANVLERNDGFKAAIRDVLTILEKRCSLIGGRINFIDGVVDVGKEIRIKGAAPIDPVIEDTVSVAAKSVLSTWRQKMVPVTASKVKQQGLFKVDREAQLYALCLPIKLGELKMGTLSFVKVCYGPFDPKAEMNFLSVLSLMFAQCAMINRFYPDQKAKEEQAPELVRTVQFERSPIIGNSKEMGRVFNLLEQVAGTDTSVLILGESGVGKELIADALHRNSPRKDAPFIKVNCAALPETLLESELFGHERGAFTGAQTQKKGRFELANGGTIFLDEIGDISPTTQIKLLRVLQEREFERLGGESTIKCDVRIITATNRNLEEMIDKGEFRQDLYYRLNVFPISIPPLRERKTDIIPITDYFVEKYRKFHNKTIRRISTPAIDMLSSYHWPGNVRELENCIERAVLLSNEGVIRGHHLPPSLQTAENTSKHAGSNLQATLDSMEKELILDALKETKGNMAKAARELGLTERVMGLRAKKYKVDPRKFKKQNV